MTKTYTTLRGNTLTANEAGTHFYMIETDGNKIRIKKSEYEQIIKEDQHEREVVAEREAEEAFENAATEEQINAAWAEVQQMIAKGEVVEHKGSYIPVWGGVWNDPMNSCFYYVIDVIEGQYEICQLTDSSREIFALRNLNANAAMINVPAFAVDGGAVEFHSEDTRYHEEPEDVEQVLEDVPAPEAKKTKKRAKKNAAFRTTINGTEITLTDKQVDFIKHLPDTYFWENGVDSIIWVDVLCDEIGGQFEGKPMTVGAMISTICEKGLGTRTKDKVNGRKATSFALTEAGKQVARTLGLF